MSHVGRTVESIGLRGGVSPHLAVARMARRIQAAVTVWRRRHQERNELGRMTDFELRDIRASRSDVWHEVRKPFWRT